MSIISADEMKQVVGTPSVDGPIAGFGVHYEVAGNASLDGPVAVVPLKLNEASLERAEKQSGVSRAPSPDHHANKTLAFADKQQERGDNKYANSFNKKLQSDVKNGTRSKMPTGSRRNYRAELSPTVSPKNPLMRVENRRRLLELRETFTKVAAQKTKPATVSAEGLPKSVLKKVAEDAINKGLNATPVGSLTHVMKLAGYNPWEKWSHALMPGSYTEAPKPKASS